MRQRMWLLVYLSRTGAGAALRLRRSILEVCHKNYFFHLIASYFELMILRLSTLGVWDVSAIASGLYYIQLVLLHKYN